MSGVLVGSSSAASEGVITAAGFRPDPEPADFSGSVSRAEVKGYLMARPMAPADLLTLPEQGIPAMRKALAPDQGFEGLDDERVSGRGAGRSANFSPSCRAIMSSRILRIIQSTFSSMLPRGYVNVLIDSARVDIAAIEVRP